MKYSDTLKYLLEQLPMFQRVGAAAYRSDLTNITELCLLLGNPERDLKCIHIAGTNGKGSVTHILASILQEQGYRVGVFVSPHYKDYRERIKINGQYINKRFVSHFVEKNQARFKHINASFFEITTAMAFAYFKHQRVDFAIIETGMGGRLDSTNIITPLLSVITNISYDHQQFLGDTLEKIAAEKAGIIKPHVPVVIGETQRETRPVFIRIAKTNASKIYFADKVSSPPDFNSDLQGIYQKKNISTALMAVTILQQAGSIRVSKKSIQNGLKNVVKNTAFLGRWMVIDQQPLTVLDSAHNEGGLRELKKQLSNISMKQLHFVYGTVGDKDITKNLSLLPKKAVYYFCHADMPRALNAQTLQEVAAKHGLKGNSYPSVKKALQAAQIQAQPADMILVAGSVFIVAEVI